MSEFWRGFIHGAVVVAFGEVVLAFIIGGVLRYRERARIQRSVDRIKG